MGLIGGSLGLALKRTGFGGQIVGVSRASTIDKALELGAIDEGWSYDDLSQALEGADLVFICTPIKRILELIKIPAGELPRICISSNFPIDQSDFPVERSSDSLNCSVPIPS